MTVMIVDDSSVDRQHLAGILAEIDCDFVLATDGEDAVQQAIANPPEIIFMDIVMPVLDGIAAARELARHTATKNIPVVFVTSKSDMHDQLWAQLLGSRGYIVKPYCAQDVTEHISGALASRSPAGAGS